MIEYLLLLLFPIYRIDEFGLVIIGERKIVLDYWLNVAVVNWSIYIYTINWLIFFYLLNYFFILLLKFYSFLNFICFWITYFTGCIITIFFCNFIILFEYLLLLRLSQIEIWYRFMNFTYLVEMCFKAIFLDLSVTLLNRGILQQILWNLLNCLCCDRKYILNSTLCFVYYNCSIYFFNDIFVYLGYHS